MCRMRVLISGAGVAGPTLAFWLLRNGFTPVLVESAPRLRTGGYVIDFWGAGFEIANRMGLLPHIRPFGYIVNEIRVVNDAGAPVVSLPAEVFSSATQGRFISIPRGDLAAAIYASLDGKVETLFGDRIAGIDSSSGDGVTVSFEHHQTRRFDLIIGADGLHSGVRRLVFGEESRFERYLGLKAAAFAAPGYAPRDPLVYVMYTQVGRQVFRFSLNDGATMFLLTFRDPDPAIPPTLAAQKALLRSRFAGAGWECPRILDALDLCSDLYFDRVSQIHMGSAPGAWSRGRVALLGDAAFCVSLLAGQGTALAMVAAYILATELAHANGDFSRAFARYRQRFGPFVLGKQKAATRMAGFFAPRSPLSLFLRDRVLGMMSHPWITRLAVGRSLIDRIDLSDS